MTKASPMAATPPEAWMPSDGVALAGLPPRPASRIAARAAAAVAWQAKAPARPRAWATPTHTTGSCRPPSSACDVLRRKGSCTTTRRSTFKSPPGVGADPPSRCVANRHHRHHHDGGATAPMLYDYHDSACACTRFYLRPSRAGAWVGHQAVHPQPGMHAHLRPTCNKVTTLHDWRCLCICVAT